jgi:Na+-driven multidrug efflux pump
MLVIIQFHSKIHGSFNIKFMLAVSSSTLLEYSNRYLNVVSLKMFMTHFSLTCEQP